MKNLNVAVIGDLKLARELGKKGTESDIALFNYKKDDVALTFISPIRYPEKLPSLLFSITMSDCAIVVVKELNAELGEVLVALNAWGLRHGFFIMRNYLQPEQLKPLLRETVLERYEFVEGDPVELRQRLTGLARELDDIRTSEGLKEGPPDIPVDHFFNVKGIGPVILGCVTGGTVKRHDKLRAYPAKDLCTVRSIQTHDRDVNEACAGDRVGLALKGISVDELDRGVVLAPEGKDIQVGSELQLSLRKSPFWKKELKNGAVVHLCTGMQFIPATIVSGENRDGFEFLEVRLDRPMVLGSSRRKEERVMWKRRDQRIFVTWLEGGSLRIMGSAEVVNAE